MKVLLMHEEAQTHGSGGLTAMYRLHTHLRQAGAESVIACRHNPGSIPQDQVRELPRSDFMESVLGTISWRVGLNEIHCVSSYKIKNWPPFLDADVLNIHGAHTNYFSYLALKGMSRRKPIICTMHDMWHLTGHCSQSYECQRWRTGCGRCPHLETYPPVGRDATAIEWKLKRRTYRKSNLTFVAPSRWLADMCRDGITQGSDIRQIPNAVDETIYTPFDKAKCRAELGVPPDKHVIMFISVAIHAKAKGGDLLAAALAALPEQLKRNSVLLVMGEKSEEFARNVGIPAISLGYVKEDAEKAVAYSAADVIVQPSRAENQSLVILEAMSCGTPIVAFDVGGNAELVNDGPCGIICLPEDSTSLSQAIASILENQSMRHDFARNAREAILRRYTLRQHARNYLDLYQEKIEERASMQSTGR